MEFKQLDAFWQTRDEAGTVLSKEEPWVDAYGTGRVLQAVFERRR